MGKNTVETKQWVIKRYGDSAPGKCPKSAVVPETITKVHK